MVHHEKSPLALIRGLLTIGSVQTRKIFGAHSLFHRCRKSLLFFGLPGIGLCVWFLLFSEKSLSAKRHLPSIHQPTDSAQTVAAKPSASAENPMPVASALPLNQQPMVVDLGAGRLSIGCLTLDRNARSITIPACVNMVDGAIEYVLVGHKGKAHESIFTTDATARDIHLAALLLGMKPAGDLGPENSAARVQQGSAVIATVEWDRNGPPEKIYLNEAIHLSDPSTGKTTGTLASGAWLYNGSRILPDGAFAASQQESIISIIRDDDALINNPNASRDNDEIHTPNASQLPLKGHPVRIILELR